MTIRVLKSIRVQSDQMLSVLEMICNSSVKELLWPTVECADRRNIAVIFL